MSALPRQLRVLAFDFGNTLIEFGPRQLDLERAGLLRHLSALGPVDTDRIAALRRRQIMQPYLHGLRENDPRQVCRELLVEGMDLAPTDATIDDLVCFRHDAFVSITEGSLQTGELLGDLARRFTLALVSNYPCGRSIRRSLEKLGWLGHFRSVVVSGDPGIGLVKPHPRPFQAMLEALGAAPGDCLFVGDNWLADVQGAKRMGLSAVLTTQYAPYEDWQPQPGDRPPDATIRQLADLPGLLA